MTPAVLGVDVGTGSARAALFAPDGRRLGLGRHPVQTRRPRPDWAEQSTADIWAAVCAAVRAALAEAGPVRPAALGFDATCSLAVSDPAGGPLPVGPDGDPAWDVILWMDHRAVQQAARANATGAAVLRHVGGALSPEMQVPKLMWLREHAPATWAAAGHFRDLPDWLTWRATGDDSRSLCSLVCKWTYQGREGRWDDAFLGAVGLGGLAEEGHARIGTEVRPPGSLAGRLRPEAAAELGLPPGLPVATSAIDAHAGAVGLLGMRLDGGGLDGDAARRRVALIGGTSSCHMALSPEPRFVPGVWGPYWGAAVPDLWLAEGGQSATGALLDHVVRAHPAAAEAGPRETADTFAWLNARLDRLAAGLPCPAAASGGLHVYPDFHGNRSPHADPTLRGMVCGLPLHADADDLARLYLAAVQGLAYGTREILDALAAAGWAPDSLVMTGGDARNPVFVREHADATGCRVVLPEEPESVLLGAALLGAVAAGLYADVPAAMAAMARPGRVVHPDPGARRLHERRYAVHKRMREDQLEYRALMADAAAEARAPDRR